jgi:hypothetical protein
VRKAFDSWTGVDVRSVLDSADPKTLRKAVNLDLITDGTFTERDGLRLVAQVDSASVGLYSVGGSLRCALAAGHSKPGAIMGPVPIVYDFLGDGTVYADGSVTEVTSVSSWDADSAQGIYPALIVKRSAAAGGNYELHWIKDTPVPDVNGVPPPAYVPSNDPVSTKVLLPFLPGPTILKIQEKMCAIDNTNGAVWFCGTVGGIEDWTTEGDAGFLPVIRHATGDRTIQGLSFYDDLMAVCFTDSMQLWQMHPSPAQMQLVRILNGPGVQYPGSLANVRGDLIYFSRGTFSSLRRSQYNGQLIDGDIGAPVFPETTLLSATTPLSVWSQARSAYYCFFGTVAWRYMTSPSSKKSGWTKYELPDGVSATAVVEHLGQLYLRSGSDIYRFDAGYADGSSYTFETPYLDFDAPSEWKFIATMDFSGAGTPAVYCLYDVRDYTKLEKICTLDGTTSSMVDIAVLENSEAPAFRLTGLVGTGFYVDRIAFSYTVGAKGL